MVSLKLPFNDFYLIILLQEELVFHNEDNTYQTVVVVHKLRASDLCQILAMKNRVRKDCHWSIVEHWVDISLGESLYL